MRSAGDSEGQAGAEGDRRLPSTANRRATRLVARRSWDPSGRQYLALRPASRRRARTRGFAAPAFAGCALVARSCVEAAATVWVGTKSVNSQAEALRHRYPSQGRESTQPNGVWRRGSARWLACRRTYGRLGLTSKPSSPSAGGVMLRGATLVGVLLSVAASLDGGADRGRPPYSP